MVFFSFMLIRYILSLVLNKENSCNDAAHVLDLNITINDGLFDISLYDKREDFPFDIVQFISNCSNMPSSISFGVFGSQLIRYFRIINSFEHFKDRVSKLCEAFINLGYNKKLMKSKFLHISSKYLFKEKFQEISTLIALLD